MTAAMDNQLPAKPLGSTWTDDQWRAIVTGGSNILVAAAAGSGKTAVLVERIIRKIAADTDVDRLLVATFTKAAAAEMKERIRIALEKELDKKPDSDHLRRQLALMGRASITTLHSFCLDVIRRYYSLIGLDPGFRIANETEAELLRMDVLDELFEERYAEMDGPGGEAFLSLVDRFGGERGDEPLYALVLKLYNFAQSNPWPRAWLQQTAASFRVSDAAELGRTEWVSSLGGSVALTLQGAESLLEQALELTRLPAGPEAYGETLQDDLGVVRSLIAKVGSQPWETWHEAFAAASFGKLKGQRGGDTIDKSLQEQVKELREQVKDMIGGLNDELFMRSPDQFAAELQESAPYMETLAELVDQFGTRFEAAKLEKGLIDFGDMEHYCLRILRDSSSTPERMAPSPAAMEYQQQFDEILLDEYQDTNMVQEAIVSLISRPGKGNRFMVGDVKQSIYRFRLAEPGLFLRKYKSYLTAGEVPVAADESGEEASSDSEHAEAEYGVRIDLARNFRSRQEVVDGVNEVFRAIMRERAAEMDYDARAELVCGASYPAANDGGPPERYAVEFAVLDRGGSDDGEERGDSDHDASGQETAESELPPESPEELQTVQLEARWIARQILRLKGMAAEGAGAEDPFLVYDGKKGRKRPLAWRDIVILLRADKQWAPVIIEELQQQGIPAYAELSSGYFEATEVETMLSLLRVIDNPYQDIPLAGALRSPIVGLSAEELALIRIAGGRVSYFEAVRKAADDHLAPEETRRKLSRFLDALEDWRNEARQGSLADLLWRIYRETGYYDLVGGMTGGLQRQANLRALHDRTRQYEATTLRGLFRFLRFIDRMRDGGGDLGTARALGEQEDVVRIMSIHKSKGLEFPVVFAAGLGKSFNRRDLHSPFLMHKQLGFGPRYVDTELRVAYPTLPYLAIKQRLAMESLAEEMRILYVALTRPKEKMFLVGTVANAEKQLQRWQTALDAEGRLPDFRIAGAARFLDWLGPLAMGAGISMSVEQSSAFEIGDEAGAMDLPGAADSGIPISEANAESMDGEAETDLASGEPIVIGSEQAAAPEGTVVPFGDWRTSVIPASLLGLEAAAGAETDEAARAAFEARMNAVQQLALIDEEADPEWAAEIDRRLSWSYPYAQASLTAAKTSVTEMKRLHAETGMDEEALLLPELAGMDGAGGLAEADFDLADDPITDNVTLAVDQAIIGNDESMSAEPVLESETAVDQLDLFSFDFAQPELPAAEAKLEQTGAVERADGGGEYTFRLRRPKFMEEAALTAAERGTVSHLVMQHIPLSEDGVTEKTITDVIEGLVARRMLSKQQAEAVDAAGAAAFFEEEVGRRLLEAPWVRRETPFSCTLPASRVYPGMSESIGAEPILIQGVIDCLFEDERGLVLLDYKTDRVRAGRWEEAAERHRFQLTLYAEAIAGILGRKVDECYVFFLDGGKAVKLF
ncbi:helicase-exonuclease AddAB subunit AddA [Paenibacillus rhizovicinus]|uniref:helicase-exonuclease AddAB subunit AddA n=1 Tax=Paenibacillus rhizovicinus TaxID=2704463 RepID=UPI001CDBC3DE|nr:helicase-exonuclease AddAB subunit AddA [Paenibacillus rhizovicinus]